MSLPKLASVLFLCVFLPTGPTRAQGAIVGALRLLDRGARPASDMTDAVIWLEGRLPRAAPAVSEVMTEGKRFTPRVLAVPTGSTVRFPNHDPFNHNVFSRSEVAPFDLGLYGRGESREVVIRRPGVVRIYCNIHATMSAVVVAVDSRFVTRPGADGVFTLTDVPPGRYTLRAWHERGGEVEREIEVGAAGLAGLSLSLDATDFRPAPHLNKLGKPYPAPARRY
jgi:plastocyanin